jgi:hypothetical protein
MNKVFKDKKSKRPLDPIQLEAAWNEGRSKQQTYELSRLEGTHCNCDGAGEFVLLPINHPAVVSGGKRYMECRKCALTSHL